MRALLFLLFFPALALAHDDWTNADTARESVFIATTLMDWGQTRDIARHPGMYEVNPILGSRPSNSRINTYFASAIAGHVVAAYLLPPSMREIFQYGSIALEVGVVAHNKSIGLRFAF